MKPIILCVGENGRAVVYGRVEHDPVPGQPVTLHGARMVLCWPQSCGGLFGLAAKGPRDGAKITATVERTTATRWTETLDVPDKAATQFDGWPDA